MAEAVCGRANVNAWWVEARQYKLPSAEPQTRRRANQAHFAFKTNIKNTTPEPKPRVQAVVRRNPRPAISALAPAHGVSPMSANALSDNTCQRYLLELQDRICAAVKPPAAKLASAGCVATVRRWRRAHTRSQRRRRVRASRREFFARRRRTPATVGERTPPRTGWPRVGSTRRIAGPASGQSLRADDAHERALLRGARRERRTGLVVRRRLRPDAVLSVRPLAQSRTRSVRAVRHRCLREIQARCDEYSF